jgi:hypothetical protein
MLDDELIAAGAAQEGTIMGTRCLRAEGEFVAMVFHKTDQLIVKLPSERVIELIAAGDGLSFAPAGRVFKEWLAVETVAEELWRALLDEGRDFVA